MALLGQRAKRDQRDLLAVAAADIRRIAGEADRIRPVGDCDGLDRPAGDGVKDRDLAGVRA